MTREGISSAEMASLHGEIETVKPEAKAPDTSAPAETSEPRPSEPQAAVFPTVSSAPADSDDPAQSLGILREVSLEVVVVLGRTVRKVGEILQMKPGSVLELDRMAGEAVELVINNQPIAKGEVVVMGEHFGVRITEILKPNKGGAI